MATCESSVFSAATPRGEPRALASHAGKWGELARRGGSRSNTPKRWRDQSANGRSSERKATWKGAVWVSSSHGVWPEAGGWCGRDRDAATSYGAEGCGLRSTHRRTASDSSPVQIDGANVPGCKRLGEHVRESVGHKAMDKHRGYLVL